jgi:mono/diheme cytochrome c family protein
MRDSPDDEDEDHGGPMSVRTARLTAAIALALSAGGAAQAQSTPEPRPVDYYRDVRGAIVFKTYCVLCHGARGDGKGRTAQHYNPPPANLTLSQASDEYKELIIRKGGAALGRSQFMPPWEAELTPEQIQDVVFYLKVINITHLQRKP